MRGLIALCFTGVVSLLVWQRMIQSKTAVLEARVSAINSNATLISELESRFNAHKLCVSENYVRRDDYVSHVSLISHKLDAQGQMLARVDERIRNWERK